jgi:hypothetical protein
MNEQFAVGRCAGAMNTVVNETRFGGMRGEDFKLSYQTNNHVLARAGLAILTPNR